jgi:hypothetical protein
MDNSKNQNINIDEIKERYGKIYKVTTELEAGDNEDTKEVAIIFKKPKTVEYNRFIKEMSKNPTKAMGNLLKSTVIEEHKQSLNETMEEYPAISSSIAEQLLKLMGHSNNINLMKL